MTQPDFTIADVLAWARTKPADETYEYCDTGMCAIAQFGLATGRPELVGLGAEQLDDLNAELSVALLEYDDDGSWERTFGGLVKRLEKLAPETIVPPSEWVKLDTYMNDLVIS